ncbi:MAG: transcriptional regulator [Gammaproteobacteria bacterium]|nr:MAG: transcriptional regulator [Gammaproteobacteria bacterium]
MTHKELQAKALSNQKVKDEYDALAPEFSLLRGMLLARENSGLSQAEIATRMGTKPPAITRLESSLTSGKHSPSLATLKKYAEAVNCHLEIKLVHN